MVQTTAPLLLIAQTVLSAFEVCLASLMQRTPCCIGKRLLPKALEEVPNWLLLYAVENMTSPFYIRVVQSVFSFEKF